MIVVELAVATLIGALFGAGAVHGVVRWRATRVPLLRVKYQRVSGKAFRRLAATFDIRHSHDPIECGCELTAADAPPYEGPYVGERPDPFELLLSEPPPVRMTYVRGPVRNQDTDHP